ncbi:MAG TPA: ABC transporter ATP-binding protein [Gammaproteobacteria bacterium]|nr:ABC transporter ATP-binding protein [Gammaproteobacteria bacterium]
MPFTQIERGVANEASDIAISVTHLSKCYQIYDSPRDRLKQFILPRFQRFSLQPPKHYFREFWALKDVTFEVKKGETVGIIGKNGSGKSTLLQIICGTLHPSFGNVEINGRVAALLELGSGFNPEFTGSENIYMYAAILGLKIEEIDERYDKIVAFADIGDFVEQPTKTYSSGMVVRLAFSVIAHVNADILVIDEALSVGDAFFVQKCMRFLREFMKKGTVLFVSHDTGAILNLCESAIWLQEGTITAEGKPKEITERYLERLYESQQGESLADNKHNAILDNHNEQPSRDMRLDFINQTSLRNDIELFQFTLDTPSFGKGGANITNVELLDYHDNVLAWTVGGERVKLVIHCIAQDTLLSPIVGFQVKDRLGQVVFGDNTYLTGIQYPVNIAAKSYFNACFEFDMPVMPVGDYTITAAIAEGSAEEHIQHFWSHDALAFKVHSTSVCYGVVGIPMKKINLSTTQS